VPRRYYRTIQTDAVSIATEANAVNARSKPQFSASTTPAFGECRIKCVKECLLTVEYTQTYDDKQSLA
jgi:hypothetical protein